MTLWLSLYLPSRTNRDAIGVEDGRVVMSVHFPTAWLEAAKTYIPGIPEYLSVMAWMFAVHEGKIQVEDRIPGWAWGDEEEARAYLKAALAERGIE